MFYPHSPVRIHSCDSPYSPKAMKLNLTLDMPYVGDEEIETLKAYGKMKDHIMRTVIVPSEMPLHALHYLINQAFGWRNSHLHSFVLSEDIRKALTDGDKLSRWAELCGVYFRFPEETDDLFWDDDFKDGETVKLWMKSKYTGPYYNGAQSENYVYCQQKVADLKNKYSEFDVRETFWEMMERHKKTGEDDRPRSKGVRRFEEGTVEELGTTINFENSFFELIERNSLLSVISLSPYEYETAKSLAKRFSIALPVTDTLEYMYDYGDSWHVYIECTDEYFACGDSYANKNGEILEGDDLLRMRRVVERQKPVCVYADGLPVMDDVGGIHGYADTLREINEEKDRDSMGWARSLGWTGRVVKPENIL